jgi:hypothetical protein
VNQKPIPADVTQRIVALIRLAPKEVSSKAYSDFFKAESMDLRSYVFGLEYVDALEALKKSSREAGGEAVRIEL